MSKSAAKNCHKKAVLKFSKNSLGSAFRNRSLLTMNSFTVAAIVIFRTALFRHTSERAIPRKPLYTTKTWSFFLFLLTNEKQRT